MPSTEPTTNRWLTRLIAGSARNPVLTLIAVAAMAVWGYMSLRGAPLDAIPDLSDVQVIIFTEWPGRSPDLVEDQITYPISTSLLAAPRVEFVRGQSFFGLSFVYVIFEDGTDIYWARSRVVEYLTSARGDLPEGVTPTLGPDATGVGWVFQYALVDRGGGYDLQQLRSLQDWNLRYALESVPGVAEVASVGGFVKQYQVNLDPNKLLAYGIPLSEVVRAVRRSNEDVGGRILEVAGHEHVIRGRGYIRRLSDLENVALRTPTNGTPIFLKDVAEIALGPDLRRGLAELNGEGEVVGGIVVMRYGENALRVINAVKERIEEIRQGLPEGVELVIVYDRSELIQDAIRTLRRTLVEEMIIVSVVIFLFLLHVRSALIPVLTLPLGVLLAFIPMYYQSLTANIMSLGGIAVAIGAMVDASVILIENIHKRREEWEAAGRPTSSLENLIASMQEVGPSIFFSLLVITVAFLPVFTLEAAEGRLFRPLAFTKTYSMGFAAILAVTLTPALAALVIRGRVRREESHPLNRWLIASYTPVVRFVVDHHWWVIGGAVLVMALTVPAALKLGSEFMPPLNEGAILYMPSAPPGMSVTEAANVLQAMDRELKEFPEVLSVFGKAGRARTATDPAPLGMMETTVVLKPKNQWRPGLEWEDLIREMDEKLRYPGMPNIWWMPVQTRTEMLATGIRSPIGIKVFGGDLATIEQASLAIEEVVSRVPGTRSAFAERSTGGFYLDFHVKRVEAARLGLQVSDVNEAILSAIGGMNVSETVEGRERYPINVRYAREWRDDPRLLERVLVAAPTGAQVPINEVADLRFVTGPPMVRSEDGQLVGFVFVDPGTRPVGDYVEEAREAVASQVRLPAGVRISWAGQFEYLERARERLKVVVPLTLVLIVVLLFLSTRSMVETGIVLLAVPFSLVGAIWLLYLLGYNVSVAVWVGIIALAGLDAETGVVMLLYLTLVHRRRQAADRLRHFADLREAIVEGAAQRIRPKLMTVVTTMTALIPILWSTGTGADVMKRIAAPMVGGLVTSFLLELTVYPAVFAVWKGRGMIEAPPGGGAGSSQSLGQQMGGTAVDA
jgi:Cu(I)/Ag(I) efflux system membrane protein CusA/SilA